MFEASDFKNKKVLVMGLGLLGGGVATAKWFLRQGAKVTVTDLKTRSELKSSIKALGPLAKKIKFVLGRHREKDFLTHDVIVVNPAVLRESKLLEIARKAGKIITNDARIFFDLVENPTIAVTGTRGKTTTVNWIAHFLKAKYRNVVIGGNSGEAPLLSIIDKLEKNPKVPVVVELSSWQLEFLPGARRSPDTAVITNLYPDHLNRYRSMKDYALAKANIFHDQNKSQKLVLNAENKWTSFFLKQKPKAQIFFFSLKPLHRKFSEAKLPKIKEMGEHNFSNLLAAALVARLCGISWIEIKKRIPSLPSLPYREEVVIKQKKLLVVNDTTATMPEATIAAIMRFQGKGELVLIAGGTDKKLRFNEWAKVVKKCVKPENLFLLEGSATKKMLRELKRIRYFKNVKPHVFESLEQLIKAIRNSYHSHAFVHLYRIILFSPAATSFEKFENEFDRGKKFNLYVKKIFK